MRFVNEFRLDILQLLRTFSLSEPFAFPSRKLFI